MPYDPLAIYASIIATVALILFILSLRKPFKVIFEPKPRRKESCIGGRDFTKRVTFLSKKGRVVIYSIQRPTRLSEFLDQFRKGSRMITTDPFTKEEIKGSRDYLIIAEENISKKIDITFKLPEHIELPFKEKTGIIIETSARTIKKKFSINWCE